MARAQGRGSPEPQGTHRIATWLASFVCLATICAVSLNLPASVAGGTTAKGPPTVGLTMAQAQRAFQVTWPKFDQAYRRVDLAQIARYVTPEALEAVVGEIGCGCGPSPERSSTAVLSVPPENTYPYWFLAQVSVKVPPIRNFSAIVYLAVFKKATESSSWRLAFLDAYGGASKFVPKSERAAPSIAPYPYGILGGELAGFFSSYVNTGGPPTWGGWPLDGSVKQTVEHYLSVKSAIDATGATQNTMTMTPTDQSPFFAYPAGAIVCGAFHTSTEITTPPNQPTVQTKDGFWGPLLAPGRYSDLEKQQLIDYCITVRRRGVVVPVSFYGWTYSITPTTEFGSSAGTQSGSTVSNTSRSNRSVVVA